MGTVTVGRANVSPIEFGRRREAAAGPRRRTFAVREQYRPEVSRHLGSAFRMLTDARQVDSQLRAATAKAADLLDSDGEVDAAHRVLVAAINRSRTWQNYDVPGLLQALSTLSVVCYFGRRAELWVPFRQPLDLLGDVAPPVLRLMAQTSSNPVAASVAVLGAAQFERHVDRLPAVHADPAQTVHLAMAAHLVGSLPDVRNALREVFLEAGEKNAGEWGVRAGLLLAVDAAQEGQWAEAETLADKCIGLCESSGERLWAWFGRGVLALVAAGRGDWNRYQAMASAVVEWATPRGALRLISDDAHHLRGPAELGATGQTRHRMDGSSPAPLTPQELEIAELAATGLTNKQIGARLYLSPRTVSAHLYRVFPKLEITSRAALRDALLSLP